MALKFTYNNYSIKVQLAVTKFAIISRVADPSDWIRIQEGKNDPQKWGKS
jgi:hypothetical protein